MYQMVASFVPDNYEDLGNLKLTVLLQHIETRLGTADQLEYKRIRFELAKQTSTEILCKFENRWMTYYWSAQINDESKFVETFKNGIYNKELRKLLLLHDPQLTTILDMKAEVQRCQTSLLKYARSIPSLATLATIRLGTLQCKDLDLRRKTMKQMQKLQCQLTPTVMPTITGKESKPVAMEVDAMLEGEGDKDEEDHEENALEEHEVLFFMEHDHQELR